MLPTGGRTGVVPEVIDALIREVAALVPPTSRVVLLTDRGLSWPALVDRCRQVGWSFLPRVQGQTRVPLPDGRSCALRELVPHPSTGWQGAGCVFKGAGWRDVNVVAVWPRRRDQPWLLLTDRPPTAQRGADHRHRTDEESSFRDDKAHGFAWDASHIRDPDHMDRLILVLQVAAAFVVAQGVFVLQHGCRHVLEDHDRRTLSLFSPGLR